MKLRKRRPTREVSIDNNFQSEEDNRPIDVADWAPNPEELYSAAELREILRKTLQDLGPGLRIVFVLRDIEGLSLEQTAEALGLSLSAVKARSWRARLHHYTLVIGEFTVAHPVHEPVAQRRVAISRFPTTLAERLYRRVLAAR